MRRLTGNNLGLAARERTLPQVRSFFLKKHPTPHFRTASEKYFFYNQ
jgi:hypothetical protein